jgi:hypothetical protein
MEFEAAELLQATHDLRTQLTATDDLPDATKTIESLQDWRVALRCVPRAESELGQWAHAVFSMTAPGTSFQFAAIAAADALESYLPTLTYADGWTQLNDARRPINGLTCLLGELRDRNPATYSGWLRSLADHVNWIRTYISENSKPSKCLTSLSSEIQSVLDSGDCRRVDGADTLLNCNDPNSPVHWFYDPVCAAGLVDLLLPTLQRFENWLKSSKESAESPKSPQVSYPKDPDVKDLCEALAKELAKPESDRRSNIQVARDFFEESESDPNKRENKAQSRLREARKFPHLWKVN